MRRNGGSGEHRRVLGLQRLDQHATVALASSGAPGHLNEQLEGALARAEVALT
jgi:hypothetical protein